MIGWRIAHRDPRVQEQPRRAFAAAPKDGHVQRPDRQLGMERFAEGATKDAFAVRVDNRCQIQPALGGGHAGDVRLPDLVARAGWGARCQAVGRNRTGVVALRGARAVTPALAALQRVFTHQTRRARPANALAETSQFHDHSWISICVFRGLEGLAQNRCERLVRTRTLASAAVCPCVIAAARDRERLA